MGNSTNFHPYGGMGEGRGETGEAREREKRKKEHETGRRKSDERNEVNEDEMKGKRKQWRTEHEEMGRGGEKPKRMKMT